MAEGGGVEYDVSSEAVIHEDGTPLPIIAQDDVPAAVPSSPVRSFFQTDTVGARCIYGVGWALPPGHASYLTGATW